MKKTVSTLLIFNLFILLVGCTENRETQIQESNIKEDSFVTMGTEEWTVYIKPVREYLYLRTQAILHNDINILWERYPQLKENIDRKVGINSEKFEVESLNRNFTVIDANVNKEGHEKIKFKKISDKEAVILVNAGIGYLRNDFEESGGEILIELHLQYEDNRWNVVKTDEYTLPEYKEWLKNKS